MHDEDTVLTCMQMSATISLLTLSDRTSLMRDHPVPISTRVVNRRVLRQKVKT